MEMVGVLGMISAKDKEGRVMIYLFCYLLGNCIDTRWVILCIGKDETSIHKVNPFFSLSFPPKSIIGPSKSHVISA